MLIRSLTVIACFLFLAGLTLVFWLTQPVWEPVKLRHEVTFAPEQLRAYVERLSNGFGPRDIEHPANLERVAQFVARTMRQNTPYVHEQPVTGNNGIVSKNIIAQFGPESDERIIVGAHFDARGPLPGADDNASGVAGLLLLAEALAKIPPPMRVELVAYTLEEYGLWGSRTHAQALKNDGKKVRAMFSLEMIGCFTDKPASQKMPLSFLKPLYPSTGNFIALVGRWDQTGLTRHIKKAMLAHGEGLDVRSISAPRSIRGVDFSDHASFWELDFPAVMVTDTAFFRNPRYHTQEDTPETLDYQRMSQVVRAVHGAVMRLATAP